MSRIVVLLFWLSAVASGGHAASVIANTMGPSTGGRFLVAVYAVLQGALVASFAVLVTVRGPAERHNHRPLPLLACALALGSAALLHAPSELEVSRWQSVAGLGLALAGTCWVLVAVAVLGRCFGILPEARGLVTRGPYRVIRHPVYLGELTAAWGLVLAAASARNLLLGALLTVAQFARMRLEERELTAAFPAYADYARATPRLLPRLGRERRTVSAAAHPSPRGSS
jgi:protein-S-isoprenylcysteine O-methyltransferase Ste14